MARVSFVVRNTSAASGSFLRYPDGSASVSLFPSRTDYDSSLRADGFQLAPASTGDSTFSVDAITYGKSLLTWTAPLVAVSTSPLPTSVQIVYSPQGAPQTVASGTVLVDTSLSSGTYSHADLPSGKWAYYSLFIHYTSTAGDDYYVKSAELEILIPTDYGSTIKLWDQLPSYVKSQDIALGDFNFSSDIGQTHGDAVGPLFKYLSIIGYDMDYMRTLIDYHMVSHDPNEAESEALNQLAITMGIPLTSGQLGSSRLRSILDNIGIYRRAKGTPAAVNLMLGAVSGSNSTYNATTHKYTLQSQRANYVTVPKTGTGLTTWRESYPGESTAGTALNLLRGAEFFIDAGRAVNAEQAALNQGTGGSALNARYGTGTGVDGSDPLLLTHTGTNHLYLPGVVGNNANLPDSSALSSLTGNIEFVIRVALDDWTPAANQPLLARSSSTFGYSWSLHVNVTSGAFVFGWFDNATSSSTGSGGIIAAATAPTGLIDGVPAWLRCRFNISNRQLSVERAADSPTEPTSWGTASLSTALASTTIYHAKAPLEIGTFELGSFSPTAGKFYRVIIRNGFSGTAALDVDFTTGITSGNQVSVPFTPSSLNPASAGANPQYISNLGTGGRALVARAGSTPAVGTDEPIMLSHTGTNYLWADAVAGAANNNLMATVTPATLVGTGTLEWRCKAFVDGTAAELMGTSASSLFGLYFSAGNLNLGLTIAGTNRFMNLGAMPTGRIVTYRATADPVSGTITGFYSLNDGATWVTGNTVTFVGAYTTFSGSYYLGQIGFGVGGSCRIYTAELITAGTSTFYFNGATDITSGAQTSGTTSFGHTFTINRVASGRKTVCVTRPTFLFGTDDYMEVADNALLDFGATDSFTVVAAVREWTNAGSGNRALIAKINSAATVAGWNLYTTTTRAVGAAIHDGTTYVSRTSAATATDGSLFTAAGVIDRTLGISTYLNGATAGPSSLATIVAPSSNALPLRIGSYSDNTQSDMELFGAAVFRRALTTTEIALINTHYQGTETTESVALLSTAVLWIDPARSSQEMAINRSTTGKKAVAVTRPTWLLSNTYMEVPDNDLLDFGATDSFTVLAVVRQWATSAGQFRPWVSKQNSTGSTQGWSLAGNSGEQTFTLYTRDASTASTSTAPEPVPVGAATVVAGVRSGTSHKTFSGTKVTDATLVARDTANAEVLRIGKAITGGQVAEGELLAVAIFRRALTATEIAAINTYYGTV